MKSLTGEWSKKEKRKKGNIHITKSDHADGLPDAQPHPRGDTAVKPLDAIAVVDVLEGLADGEVLGPVRVVLLALHLDTDDFNGLVPGRETTTQARSQDLLPGGQLLVVFLAGEPADAYFRRSRQPEARTPVGGLADGHGVDAAVDPADAFLAVDVHERLEGARGLHTLSGHLVLGDLHRLHARTEPHGGVCLGHSARHTSGDSRDEIRRAQHLGAVFRFRCDKQQNRSFGGGLNPGPRNETLIVYVLVSLPPISINPCRSKKGQRTTKDPTTTPYPTHGTDEAVAAIGSHGRLDHFQRLAQRCDPMIN